MLCDICHKSEATIHVTEVINEEIQEIHICEECAEKKGMAVKQNFGLADFLAGLTDFGLASAEKEMLKETKLTCPNCGLTFEDFRKIGRLGCSKCYETFKSGLVPLLKKIHGSPQHTGKAPKGLDEGVKTEGELENLEESLRQVVEREEFEEAARIRDKIKELKDKKSKEDRK